MRPSTAAGWYVLSIIVDFASLRGRKPAHALTVNAAQRPADPQQSANVDSRCAASPRPSSHRTPTRSIIAARGRGLRQPGPGAGDRFAAAADRGRLPHHRRRRRHRRDRLCAAHGSIQLVIGPVGDRFGKYRTVAADLRDRRRPGGVCAAWPRSLPQLTLARLATGAAGRLGHSDLDGLCRRRHALRAAPDRARPLPRRARSSASCSARPPAACSAIWSAGATCSSCSPAMFALAAVGLVFELVSQSADRAARPRRERNGGARLRRRLRRRAVEPVGPHRHPRRLHRGRAGLGRLRLCRRRPASALRPELHAGRR